MKKILYLFRHGETEWNINKNLKYSEEVHNCLLTENGIEQANELANKLKNSDIQCIYSSHLKRALQTSKIVANFLRIDINIIEDLQEFSIYDDTCIGFTRDELGEKIDKEKRRKQLYERDELMDWRPFLNCETKREARDRIYSTILNICSKTEYDIIGIGSHGSILKEFLRACDYENDSKLANCEYFKAEFDGISFNIFR